MHASAPEGEEAQSPSRAGKVASPTILAVGGAHMTVKPRGDIRPKTLLSNMYAGRAEWCPGNACRIDSQQSNVEVPNHS